jgi:hypothetical protein
MRNLFLTLVQTQILELNEAYLVLAAFAVWKSSPFGTRSATVKCKVSLSIDKKDCRHTSHEARCRVHIALNKHTDVVLLSLRDILLLCLRSKDRLQVQNGILLGSLYTIHNRPSDTFLKIMVKEL